MPTENTAGREIFRLLKIAREAAQESLLDEALAGRPKDVNTLCRLYKFVRDSFGPAESPYPRNPALGSETTKKYWLVVSAFLESAGLDQKEIEKVRDPYKNAGCVLDEFKEF